MVDYTDISRLILNCLSGDESAVEQLVQLYQNNIFRLALSVLDDPTEASDVTQETFIAAISKLEFYQDEGVFKTWIYTIALNKSRSRLRKLKTIGLIKKTILSNFQIQSQKQPTTEEIVMQNEKDAVLWKAMETLNERHRIPLLLRYYHNLSVSDIAKILNIAEGTVASRLHTAREKLRYELEKGESIYWE